VRQVLRFDLTHGGMVPSARRVALREALRTRARHTRRKMRLKRVPPQRRPNNIEKTYARALLGMLAEVRAIINDRIVARLPYLLGVPKSDDDGERADDIEVIGRVFSEVRLQVARVVTRMRARSVAERIGAATGEHTKAELSRQTSEVLGIDILQGEPWLAEMIEEFTGENVKLITSIPAQYLDQVEQLVGAAALSGTRPETLAKDIGERFGVAESRAILIARDQVSKFAGQTNRVRQQSLGITGYIWRSSGDERTRASHAANDGKSFQWSKPPRTGHPGQDYQCRCTAEPDFSGLL
jgi:SPP1 gp7 family putative phage head morphogenesis protein